MKAHQQLLRYILVGLFVNSIGYVIYLGVTWFGVEPKVAVSVLYPAGVMLTFLGHSRYSFSYRGRRAGRLPHFFTAHGIGYGTNLGLLYLIHDRMQWPHQLAQLIAIVVVAGELFLLMRYVVFPHGACERASP